jgi:hypothetical protein
MIQFTFFLIALFLIACVLYGIAAGVQTVARGASWLSEGQVPKSNTQRIVPEASPAQRSLRQLQELHGLYQSGALTEEEYEQFKQYLLSSIAPAADGNRPNAA